MTDIIQEATREATRYAALSEMPDLSAEQTLEIQLIEKKSVLSAEQYAQLEAEQVSGFRKNNVTIPLYGYRKLQSMRYTVDNIVEKTVSLSAGDISGYASCDNESQYWMAHRRNNMSLFIGALYAGVMIGHFSAMSVLAEEAREFLDDKRKETEFSVISPDLSESESYYLYISAVVVRKEFRDSSVPFRLIRQGYKMLLAHLKSTPNAKGIFAEAYSDEGARMCQLFGMHNVRNSLFVKEA